VKRVKAEMMSTLKGWLLVAVLAGFAGNPVEGQECIPTKAEIREVLGQELRTFDQSPKGWRKYGDEGCHTTAATLIERYIAKSNPPKDRVHLLHFHAGQEWAYAEEAEPALRHFKQSYKATEDELVDWNSYVEATVAFFERDRETAEAMRRKLGQQPPLTREIFPGLREDWVGKRPNLPVVEGLLACWNEPYRVAVSAECQERGADIETPAQ